MAIGHRTYDALDERSAPPPDEIRERAPMRVLPPSLTAAGFLVALIAAWVALVPFVGPTFGFDGTGPQGWHWTLANALLAVAPGAAAFVAGVITVARAPRAVFGRGRGSIAAASTLAALAGAWLLVGPAAWPALEGHSYLVAASPLRELAYVVAYGVGPGALLCAVGGFTLGWVARHQVPGGRSALTGIVASGG
ncbi:MAG TPA: hypothetical protein VMV02_04065 [Acidimicrobiales bacterium]|nr:hypothetical protein [Acidimicrobiales bacterium]